jgi:hypothetical protein
MVSLAPRAYRIQLRRVSGTGQIDARTFQAVDQSGSRDDKKAHLPNAMMKPSQLVCIEEAVMPRIGLRGPVAIAAAAALITFGIIPATHASAPGPPFTQCPAVGADAGCALLIDIDSSGHVGISQDPTQGPFDALEDTLIGVVNESATPIASLPLSSGTNIFAFDLDGICAAPTTPKPVACPFGPTGYEGPGTSFSDISADAKSGVVHFNPAIPQGGTAYFSLEQQLSLVPPNNIIPGPPNMGAVKISDAADEPVVAVNPTNPKNIVVAYNHVVLINQKIVTHCGYSVSTDGGANWSPGKDLQFPPDPNKQLLTNQGGDPALAFTRSGKLYFTCIAGADDAPKDKSDDKVTTSAIYSAISKDGGASFPVPTIIARGVNNAVFRDQEQLAASPVDDSVYMCFADRVTTPAGNDQWAIFLSRLDATGKRIATGSVTAGLHEDTPIGCTVGVAGSGRVWVGWWNTMSASAQPTVINYSKDSLAEVAYSDLAATQNPIPFTGHTVLGPKNGVIDADVGQPVAWGSRHVWVKPSPIPGDNRVQSVWEDDSATHDLRAASFDGSTWSPNSSIFQNVFQPALSWTADGASVGFYQDSSTPARATSLLYTVARLNSNQISALHTVATAQSNALSNPGIFGRFGDYTSITSANGVMSAAWSDNSNGHQTVWFGH